MNLIMFNFLGNFKWFKGLNKNHVYALLGFILIILISIPLAEKLSKRYKINNEIKDLEKKISTIENKNNEFSNLIKYLESDEFIDEQARLKLNYKGPGENVYIIKGAGTSSSTDTVNQALNPVEITTEKKNPNNFVKWLAYFFK